MRDEPPEDLKRLLESVRGDFVDVAAILEKLPEFQIAGGALNELRVLLATAGMNLRNPDTMDAGWEQYDRAVEVVRSLLGI